MVQDWQIKEGLGGISFLVHVGSLSLYDKEQVCKISFRGLAIKELKKECLKHSNIREAG